MEPTRESLAALARLAADRPGFDPRVATRGGSDRIVRQMPGWIARVVVLADDDQACWLWCEAETRSDDDPYSGQMVLDKPAGRYLVDVFEPVEGRCVSRESAAGSPLVAGLPRVADRMLVYVRRTATGEQQ